jgi:uncharacterized membrane protein
MSNLERGISSVLGSFLLVRALTGKKSKPLYPALIAVGGAELLRWGISGSGLIHSIFGINTAVKGKGPVATVKHGEGIKHIKYITINQPPTEIYRFWRNFENLPRFMEHLKEVKITGANTSHWIVKGPAGTTVEWDAVIHNEIPNKLIAWRSVETSDVNNAGSVEFNSAREGQATDLKVEISYEPPAGKIGTTLAKLFGEEPGQQLEDDLRHLKHLLEKRLTPETEPATKQ